MQANVAKGLFREDLLARINLWTFKLPGLSERTSTRVTFNREARLRFLAFAASGEALWSANFRDLSGAVTRMATLAPGGRITVDVVDEEIGRLRRSWPMSPTTADDGILAMILGNEAAGNLDLFDKVQFGEVLRVCRVSRNLSEAGRSLFQVTRQGKKTANDADRLRKYLVRFNIQWDDIKGKLSKRMD